MHANTHIRVAYCPFGNFGLPHRPPGGSGGFPGRGDVGSIVGSLCQSGGGAMVPSRPQCGCVFFAVPSCQGRHPSVRFCQSLAGCLYIPDFTLLCAGDITPRFFCSRTSA